MVGRRRGVLSLTNIYSLLVTLLFQTIQCKEKQLDYEYGGHVYSPPKAAGGAKIVSWGNNCGLTNRHGA